MVFGDFSDYIFRQLHFSSTTTKKGFMYYRRLYLQKLFCTDSVKLYTEYLKILKNIHRSAVTFNAKDYHLFLFQDIV